MGVFQPCTGALGPRHSSAASRRKGRRGVPPSTSKNLCVVALTRKRFGNGFGELCVHAKPWFDCDNASSIASRHASLFGLDPPEPAAPVSEACAPIWGRQCARSALEEVTLTASNRHLTIVSGFGTGTACTKTHPKQKADANAKRGKFANQIC
jgi:hypothetical protein